MSARLKGLCWNHRRATAPLAAATARLTELEGKECIKWQTQPLSGFEHGLTAALAEEYDLIVFDHPFCGDVARDQLFVPLDDLLTSYAGNDFIGQSLASYRYRGHLWALPIDGATQVAAFRPDILECKPPQSWEDVLELGKAVRATGRWLGLAVVAPHGFLVLLALLANLGSPLPQERSAKSPFERNTLLSALQYLRAVCAYVHPDCLNFNAIDLHEAMSCTDRIVYSPAVYGYLTYSEADRHRPLRFADFPGPRPPYWRGTVLGGTGLGMTRSCRDIPLAKRFIRMIASGDAQKELFAGNHGQPGHLAAWHDRQQDARVGGAFSATLRTMENAWIRPRFAGYVAFQKNAGRALADHLKGDLTEEQLIRTFEREWLLIPPP